jgi:hypothetical protein
VQVRETKYCGSSTTCFFLIHNDNREEDVSYRSAWALLLLEVLLRGGGVACYAGVVCFVHPGCSWLQPALASTALQRFASPDAEQSTPLGGRLSIVLVPGGLLVDRPVRGPGRGWLVPPESRGAPAVLQEVYRQPVS